VTDYNKKDFMRVPAVFFVFAVLFCTFPARALSRVLVYDTVAVKDQKIMLKAETRGKLFSKGGQLVELFVDGKSLGKNLSGGDGVVFKAYTPSDKGLFQIRAKSDGDEGVGLLLSLDRDSSIVFVDVEGGLLEGVFPMKPREGAQKAIEEIEKTYPVVFLQTSLVGVRAVKNWLEEYEFMGFPVMPWRKGKVFDKAVAKDLKIKAIIGAPKVIESAEKHHGLAFSFEAVNGAEKVKGWEEIANKLQ
jgi:hypothetical protein